MAALEAMASCYPCDDKESCPPPRPRTPTYSFGMALACYAQGFSAGRRVELQRAEDGIAYPDPVAPTSLEGEALRAWRQGVQEGGEQGAKENRETLVL